MVNKREIEDEILDLEGTSKRARCGETNPVNTESFGEPFISTSQLNIITLTNSSTGIQDEQHDLFSFERDSQFQAYNERIAELERLLAEKDEKIEQVQRQIQELQATLVARGSENAVDRHMSSHNQENPVTIQNNGQQTISNMVLISPKPQYANQWWLKTSKEHFELLNRGPIKSENLFKNMLTHLIDDLEYWAQNNAVTALEGEQSNRLKACFDYMLTLRHDFFYSQFRKCISYKCGVARHILRLYISEKFVEKIRCIDEATKQPYTRTRTILKLSSKSDDPIGTSLNSTQRYLTPSVNAYSRAATSLAVNATFISPDTPVSFTDSDNQPTTSSDSLGEAPSAVAPPQSMASVNSDELALSNSTPSSFDSPVSPLILTDKQLLTSTVSNDNTPSTNIANETTNSVDSGIVPSENLILNSECLPLDISGVEESSSCSDMVISTFDSPASPDEQTTDKQLLTPAESNDSTLSTNIPNGDSSCSHSTTDYAVSSENQILNSESAPSVNRDVLESSTCSSITAVSSLS